MSAARLMELINGYRISQAISVAAQLGLADVIGQRSVTIDELASATGSDPRSLSRLMQALAGLGLFEEQEGKYSVAELGRLLRTDEPESLHSWAIFAGRPYYWQAWMALGDAVRTGDHAFRLAHGTDAWSYRKDHPEEGQVFDRAMQAATATVDAAILDSYDFSNLGTVADIGGGNGALLAAILVRHPTARGILFDQPHVVREEILRSAGVLDRCTIIGGSFFEGVPTGANLYLMKAILHDWEDRECEAILRSCRTAMERGARLLVIERELGSPESFFSDLNMMVVPGGQERTRDQFGALFAETGFRFDRVIATASRMSIFEAVAD